MICILIKKASKLFAAHKIEFGGFAMFLNFFFFFFSNFWRGKIRKEFTPN